jgi:hypothetical protein
MKRKMNGGTRPGKTGKRSEKKDNEQRFRQCLADHTNVMWKVVRAFAALARIRKTCWSLVFNF